MMSKKHSIDFFFTHIFAYQFKTELEAKAWKYSAKEDSHNIFQAATRKKRKVSEKACTCRNLDQRDEDI